MLAVSPQQQAPPGIDVKVRSSQIVAHLNAMIQFYRSCTQPIQKAGEPNDVVYRDQATVLAAQAAAFAFQSAKAQAALMAVYRRKSPGEDDDGDGDQEQRIETSIRNNDQQIASLTARKAALDFEISHATPKNIAALQAERQQLEGSLKLDGVMKDALQKIIGITDVSGSTGLAADIERLRSSVPELESKNKVATSLLVTIDSAQSEGVTTQGSVLIDLLGTRHSLDDLLSENARLRVQAVQLRAPLLNALRGLLQQGQQISEQELAAVPSPATQLKAGNSAAAKPQGSGKKTAIQTDTAAEPGNQSATKGPPQQNIDAITTEFKSLSETTVPLSQEIIILDQSRANLLTWQTSITQEYDSILHTLLLRLIVIIAALALIFGSGEIWRHATTRYISDIRRRRQLLIIQRVVVGFLSVIVVLFGFVTQFNSLATFAGFITAGIAVGLQTILLSVAAYFFIIGRYGIKVGDRITIASVTGDVIDVGLVRFYMMELAGSGTELNATGRVAMFSNAVLFQALTPLYKQVPGTEYAWRELIVKLADNANYRLISDAVMKVLNSLHAVHRAEIETQHKNVQARMQIPMSLPAVESRIQYNGGAFQIWARFPVMISRATEMEEQLTEALVDLLANNPEIKAGVAATPVIQAAIRG
jgi:small-conductance mechanosensitive channel